MAHFVELERTCVRDYADLEMTIPEAIEWLQEHLAKVPPALHDQTVFRASMEHGYYEGDVDCFIEIGFFPEDETPRGAAG